MIDIHSHILPGTDDGSADIEESVEMAAMVAESGVYRIAATPHCNIPEVFDNYLNKHLLDQFDSLNRVLQKLDIPVEILRGMEIFATPELPKLIKEEKVLTLNGSPYFLTEFAFDEDPDFCKYILQKCSDIGLKPVIAHPERYYFVQDDPETVIDWIKRGYAVQVNKGGVLGRFGRSVQRAADWLLDNGLVSCIASDAHSYHSRTPHMGEIYEYLLGEYGAGYADMLTKINPARILAGQPPQLYRWGNNIIYEGWENRTL